MFGNLATIKRERIEGPELTVGDVIRYNVGDDRYFVIQRLDPYMMDSELFIQEYANSSKYEPRPSSSEHGRYGRGFPYELRSAKRNFTRIISLTDRTIKMHFCNVVTGALFSTDELRNLLVELEI